MMIELLDYQLIALILAAWASGCVTVYVIEERQARKEYRKRMERKALLMQGYNAGPNAFKEMEDFNAFLPEATRKMWDFNKHSNEAMKIANED